MEKIRHAASLLVLCPDGRGVGMVIDGQAAKAKALRGFTQLPRMTPKIGIDFGKDHAQIIKSATASLARPEDARRCSAGKAGSACGALPASVDPGGRDVAPGSASSRRREGGAACLSVLTQFRTENRFTLFLELLELDRSLMPHD
ncbi:hypothetical protein [Mesorhizobium sp. CA12]|uniref:hypothetical protein n=1 Tax=Mesorhizobium sp. CA12 TaxID=2876644 RepID=UPI001CCA89CE|nr:hypothetical protein [Mesorhizobium sp. CA12]MBZ9859223.1 hypothetical protein [Mesorhizobium sp. CA12]